MFKKRIPIFYLILAVLCTSTLTFYAFSTINKIKKTNNKPGDSIAAVPATVDNNYNLLRLNGYHYIKPVFLTEREAQSPKFSQFSAAITDYLNYERSADSIETAAVYLLDFSENEWMVVNNDEKFHPGSLAKVAVLITYLRMAETKPGLLDHELLFDKNIMRGVPWQSFNSKTIEPGKHYKIKDLLHSMIAYSDNYALVVLNLNIDRDVFKKVFTDLNIRVPDLSDISSSLTVKEYSKFLRVLYDASYLNIPASEYAVSLLAECDFNLGLKKELPATVKVAHKFGQWGDDHWHELHESGIIYLDGHPYLLTVMTRGKSLSKQAATISHISKMAYDYMVADHAMAITK